MIMRLAPIGAFGAMAFTIGKYGVGSLVQLGQPITCLYITCVLFVLMVLGLIARVAGFNIFRFVAYIKEELLIVLGTSSSESALPRMLDKMEKLGCKKSVVGLVTLTGYSFNFHGTSIYLTIAAVFTAQATNAHMYVFHQSGGALFEERGGSARQRLYRAGDDTVGGGPSAGRWSGADSGHRPIYVRSVRVN